MRGSVAVAVRGLKAMDWYRTLSTMHLHHHRLARPQIDSVYSTT
jgi:hypothetical protein